MKSETENPMIPDTGYRTNRRRHGMLLIVMLACVAFQTTLGLYLGYWQHLATVKHFADDTKTYYEVANWLLDALPFDQALWSIATRPMGYPLVLGLCDLIAPSTIVVLQIVFWCLAQMAVFSIVLDRSNSLLISCLVTAVSATCITLAVLPFFALTETLAISCSVLGLYFAHRYDTEGVAPYLILFLTCMSIAAMIRPAGLYPLIAVGMGVFVALRKEKKLLAAAIICLLPVAIQIGLLYTQFGVPKVSIIDSVTIDQYLLSRADTYLRKVSLPLAREVRRKVAYYPAVEAHHAALVARYDQYAHDQFRTYLVNAPQVVSKAYRDNLVENMSSGSGYVGVIAEHPLLFSVSLYQNIVISYGGIILALLSIFLTGARALHTRSITPFRLAWLEVFVAGLLIYCMLISGISYWQGDRLSLPAYVPALILAGMWLQRVPRPAGFVLPAFGDSK